MRNLVIAALLTVIVGGCVSGPRAVAPVARRGDEMVACGQLLHTGTRIVLWNDPGGFSAYTSAPGTEFNDRSAELHGVSNPELLRPAIDQFVLHYDACGSSRECFRVLHEERHLSVHFMLDLDGTLYQTLDLRERAWHATTSNTRSIGIEIANIGAFSNPDDPALLRWRAAHPNVGRLMRGTVQGQVLYQYDLTPQQYASLIKLVGALCANFPRITCDYPRKNEKLSDVRLRNFHGVLGHYHIQLNKQDPGPAFQWDRVINGARTYSQNAVFSSLPAISAR